jgi:hypothetical protein
MAILKFLSSIMLLLAKIHGLSESALHTRLCLAHHAPLSQAGIPAKILTGSAPVPAMALSGQEAIWPEPSELHRHLKPCPPACCGWRRQGRHPAFDTAVGKPNGPGVQSEKEPQGGILRGSLSCNGCGLKALPRAAGLLSSA